VSVEEQVARIMQDIVRAAVEAFFREAQVDAMRFLANLALAETLSEYEAGGVERLLDLIQA
jgi:hypothetical protein